MSVDELSNCMSAISVSFDSMSDDMKTKTIKTSNDITPVFVSNLLAYPANWKKYKNMLAKRIGQLGDKSLTQYIIDIAKPSGDMELIYSLIDGGFENHHVIKTCIHLAIEANNNDIIYYICGLNNNDVIRVAISLGVPTHKLLFGCAMVGNLFAVTHFIESGETDIMYGFYGACFGGSLNIVNYYLSNILNDISCNFKALSYALEGSNYSVVETLIHSGLNIEPILNRTETTFDYGKLYDKLMHFFTLLDDIQ